MKNICDTSNGHFIKTLPPPPFFSDSTVSKGRREATGQFLLMRVSFGMLDGVARSPGLYPTGRSSLSPSVILTLEVWEYTILKSNQNKNREIYRWNTVFFYFGCMLLFGCIRLMDVFSLQNSFTCKLYAPVSLEKKISNKQTKTSG